MDKFQIWLTFLCGVHLSLSIPNLVVSIDRGPNMSKDLSTKTSFIHDERIAIAIFVISALGLASLLVICRIANKDTQTSWPGFRKWFLTYQRFNFTDFCFVVLVMLHAFMVVFPKGVIMDLNIASMFFAVAFLSRHVFATLSYSEDYNLKLFGLDVEVQLPLNERRDGAPTPASSTTRASKGDIAVTRNTLYHRSGISRSGLGASSIFTYVATILLLIALSSFVYLTVESLSARPCFYSDETLAEMNHLERLTPYWPLDPPIYVPLEFTPKDSFFAALRAEYGTSNVASNLRALRFDRKAQDLAQVQSQAISRQTVTDSEGRRRNQMFAVPVETQFSEGDETLLSAAARRVEDSSSSTLSTATLELKRLKRLGSKRVLVVVLDGLRFDHLTTNKDMNDLMKEIEADAKILKMRAQLPSMSVPNWITLVSGSPPEITGVFGNLLIPDQPIDHIFRRASLFDDYIDVNSYDFANPQAFLDRIASPPFPRGLTASPWFGTIMESTVSKLYGFGLVATNYVAPWEKVLRKETDETSAEPADRVRAGIALEAISRVTNPYQLFLAHFSDIDQQGHCCGVTKKYNSKNSYYKAVTQKAKILKAMLNAVQNHPTASETVVVVVSDHGHVDAGGHGGYNNELLDVPLIIYSPQSGLSTKPAQTSSGDKFGLYPNPDSHFHLDSRMRGSWPSAVTNPFTNQDSYVPNTAVAPTISALLGIPIPRQSLGWIVNEALPLIDDVNLADKLYDLYVQKRELFRVFLGMSGKTYEASELKLNIMQADYNQEKDVSKSMRAVESIVGMYQETRATLFRRAYTRNVSMSLFAGIAIILALVSVLNYGSPVYLRAFFSSFFKSHTCSKAQSKYVTVEEVAEMKESQDKDGVMDKQSEAERQNANGKMHEMRQITASYIQPFDKTDPVTTSTEYSELRMIFWETLLGKVWKRFEPQQQLSTTERPAGHSETWTSLGEQLRVLQRLNWWAGWAGLLCVILSLGISLAIFLIVYSSMGYTTFEFTALHTTGIVMARYICLGFFVPLIMQILFLRLFIIHCMIESVPEKRTQLLEPPRKQSACAQTSRDSVKFLSFFQGLLFAKYDIAPEFISYVQLFYRYTLFWQCVAILILTISQADYEFAIPYIYPTYFVSPITWANRFRTLTLQLMLIPQAILTILQVRRVLPPNLLTSKLDGIYLVHLYKERSILMGLPQKESVIKASEQVSSLISILSGNSVVIDERRKSVIPTTPKSGDARRSGSASSGKGFIEMAPIRVRENLLIPPNAPNHVNFYVDPDK